MIVPELTSPRDDIGTRLSSDGATMYLNYNTVTAGAGISSCAICTASSRRTATARCGRVEDEHVFRLAASLWRARQRLAAKRGLRSASTGRYLAR